MASHPQYQMNQQQYQQYQQYQQQFEANPSALSPYTQYLMTPAGQPTPSPANVGHGSEVSSLESSSNSRKGKDRQEAYEMQPVEGGHQTMANYHQQELQQQQLQQQQGYFDGGQIHPSQVHPSQFQHPGQMFPNMYQQHAQPGPIGFEEDAKK
jgi:hypothetical protein